MGVTRCARATISAGVQDIGVKYASTPLSATLSACWETRPATIRARSPACLFQHQPKKAVRQTSLGSTSAEEKGYDQIYICSPWSDPLKGRYFVKRAGKRVRPEVS